MDEQEATRALRQSANGGLVVEVQDDDRHADRYRAERHRRHQVDHCARKPVSRQLHTASKPIGNECANTVGTVPVPWTSHFQC